MTCCQWISGVAVEAARLWIQIWPPAWLHITNNATLCSTHFFLTSPVTSAGTRHIGNLKGALQPKSQEDSNMFFEGHDVFKVFSIVSGCTVRVILLASFSSLLIYAICLWPSGCMTFWTLCNAKYFSLSHMPQLPS